MFLPKKSNNNDFICPFLHSEKNFRPLQSSYIFNFGNINYGYICECDIFSKIVSFNISSNLWLSTKYKQQKQTRTQMHAKIKAFCIHLKFRIRMPKRLTLNPSPGVSNTQCFINMDWCCWYCYKHFDSNETKTNTQQKP